jgi:ubiquinone/menaquinone biosynthesis C-methylase UbiE
MPKNLTDAEWDARAAAWHDRVQVLGVERSIYNRVHTAPEFPAVTAMQVAAIWPHLLAALDGTEARALDFGCGYGRWTPQLADLVGSALGVDPTPELLAHAEATRPIGTRGRLEYAAYVRGHIPAPDASFDVLWSCMVLSTILEERMFQATLLELRRVMRRGGLVCLIDNTARVGSSKPIRGTYSMSRTIAEYRTAFAPWADLRAVGDYIDHGEINSVLVGRVHA